MFHNCLITLPSVDRDQRQNLAKGGMSNRTPSLSRLTSGFGYVGATFECTDFAGRPRALSFLVRFGNQFVASHLIDTSALE